MPKITSICCGALAIIIEGSVVHKCLWCGRMCDAIISYGLERNTKSSKRQERENHQGKERIFIYNT